MASDISIKIGDKIIDYDQIHVVFKIDDDIIHYESLIKGEKNKNLQSAISSKNFKKAGIRFLMTKKQVQEFLISLNSQMLLDMPINTNKNNNLKEIIYLNDPLKTGRLLKFLWQRRELPIYTKVDQMIFDQAINHLSNEISVVEKISFEKAKSKIITELKK